MKDFRKKQTKAIETFFRSKSFVELTQTKGEDGLSGTERALLIAFAAGYKVGYQEATS